MQISPVLPVLDLMIGQIVLAQGGQRDGYRPVHSRLTTSSQPVEVAQAIFNQTGCDWLYLADIDSFAGAVPNWNTYNDLLDKGFGLWIDADWITNQRYRQIIENLGSRERLKIIVSSETIQESGQFAIFQELAAAGLGTVFSLDKKGDTVITQTGELVGRSPVELVGLAYDQGVRDLIVLDLQQVGTAQGFQAETSAAALIKQFKNEWMDLRITSGGGVRNVEDVEAWMKIGCQHVLVASAIHQCTFTPDDVSHLRWEVAP